MPSELTTGREASQGRVKTGNHIPESGSARYAGDVASELPLAMKEIGDYRVIRALGASSAVDVLLATYHERSFVIRVLGESYARNARYAEAFERGAAAYADLAHPAIARVQETLRVQGRPAVVIEHVDGAALNRVRGMMRTVGFGLDDTAALHVAAGIFAALAEAHALSPPVVHRYLSPSKVLLGWDGVVKVRDFGLPEPAKLNASAVAVARGADRYMAPEQVNGKDVTPRTDVYDAALILWELLAKKRAFRSAKRTIDTWRSMAEPRLETLDKLRPDLDVRIRDVLRTALAPRPEDRTVTARQLALVLREIVPEGEGLGHLSALMEMVRHEPSPLPSELPPDFADAPPPMPPRVSRPAPNPRSSLPTLDLSPPAPRAATHVSAGAAAAASVASVEPPTPEGAVTAVMTALDLASKRLSSGTMPAVKAGPPARTSSVKMRAAAPTPGPKRTSSAKMPAAKPPPLPPRPPKPIPAAGSPPPPQAARSSSRMPAAAAAPPVPAAPSSSRMPAAAGPPPVPAAPSSSRMPAAAAAPPPVPAAPSSSRMPAAAAPAPNGAVVPVPIVAAAPPASDDGDRPSFMSAAKVLVIDIADKPARDHSEAVTVTPPGDEPTEESVIALPLTKKIEPTVVVAEEPAHPARVPAASDAWFETSAEQEPPRSAPSTDAEAEAGPDLSRSRPTEVSIARAAREERSRSWTATLLFLGLIGSVGAVGADALGWVRLPVSVSGREAIMRRARTWLDVTESNKAGAPGPTAPTTAEAAPAPPAPLASASSEPAPPANTSAEPAAAIPGDMGMLKTTGLAPGRRIFVDERTVGQTPESVLVKCGAHTVMIGSAGRRQAVDIPCGGELNAGER
jgi:eukaryotic-like serine/threonine-protein kinase